MFRKTVLTHSPGVNFHIFDSQAANETWRSDNAPAPTTHNDLLWMFVRTCDGPLRAPTRNGAWSSTHLVSEGS
ncbi:hypothetical protein ACTPOK_00250 [Streptomyces inhibens]|uniref:hypothetical protein n=1 Tax=Streptomyces inhibens TaxID=2293571 RepID=UPI00402AB0B8